MDYNRGSAWKRRTGIVVALCLALVVSVVVKW